MSLYLRQYCIITLSKTLVGTLCTLPCHFENNCSCLLSITISILIFIVFFLLFFVYVHFLSPTLYFIMLSAQIRLHRPDLNVWR